MRAAGFLSDAADQLPSFVACGAVLSAGVILRRPRLAEVGARMLASTLTAAFLKDRVKAVVSRTRPRAVLEGDPYVLKAGSDPGKDEHSFPSGHTSGAVAAARAWARVYPERAALAHTGAAAVALVQLPRGKHYPADLVAGMAVGVTSEAIVAAATAFVHDRLAIGEERDDGRGVEHDRRCGRRCLRRIAGREVDPA